MDRYKQRFGWICKLTPEEVRYAQSEIFLKDSLRKMKSTSDGGLIFKVAPWILGSLATMELFMDGLGEAGFNTNNVHRVGSVEVLDQEKF